MIDLSHPHLQPLHEPRRALVWLANRANVDVVMVDGCVLLRDGRLVAGLGTAGEEAAITAVGVAAIRRIWDLPEAQAAFEE